MPFLSGEARVGAAETFLVFIYFLLFISESLKADNEAVTNGWSPCQHRVRVMCVLMKKTASQRRDEAFVTQNTLLFGWMTRF